MDNAIQQMDHVNATQDLQGSIATNVHLATTTTLPVFYVQEKQTAVDMDHVHQLALVLVIMVLLELLVILVPLPSSLTLIVIYVNQQ